jgi:hypothetical protein
MAGTASNLAFASISWEAKLLKALHFGTSTQATLKQQAVPADQLLQK